MKMYHATDFANLNSILEKGLLTGHDGLIYLTEKQEDAVKFLAIRGCKDILAIKLEFPKSKLIEQFNHSESFFGCKAFAAKEDIPVEMLDLFIRYNL